MTGQELFYDKITAGHRSVRNFALSIGMPPQTLMSILQRDITRASFGHVLAIIRGLGMTLFEVCGDGSALMLTEKETTVMRAYQAHPEFHEAIDRLLEIPPDSR